MVFQKFWEKVIFAKWIIGIFLGAFAVLWLLAEPLGITPGIETFIFLFISAFILISFWLLGRRLYSCLIQINKQTVTIAQLKKQLELEKVNRNYCCVIKQSVDVCPLGINAIYDQTIQTLQSSLLEAKQARQ